MKTCYVASILLGAPLVEGFSLTPSISFKKHSVTQLDAKLSPKSRRHVLQSAFVASGLVGSAATATAVYYEYLEEPTEEFKENERKAMEFRQAQLAIKKKFTGVLDRLTNDSKSEQDIIDCLADLKVLVQTTGGLPVGLKKDVVIKTIRAKKKLGNWSTSTEIAYQGLLREIEYQQSPNTGGSMEDKMNYSIN